MPTKRSRRRHPRPRLQPRKALLLAAAAILLLLSLILILWSTSRPPPDILARVLFAETANCTPAERLLVAGVIRNRVNHPAFGNLSTVRDVVAQRGAFSCIDDPDNANWAKSRHPQTLRPSERQAWDHCLAIARQELFPVSGPSGRPLVYYHDKSIRKPPSWDNDRWHATLEITTPHFLFYSIVPARK